MKRELSGGITSRKRFAGKLDFSAKQVSTTLLLLLLGLLLPQKGWAEIITTTYDFEASARNGNYTVSYSNDNTITYNRITCNYFTQLGNVSNPERFAAQGADKFSVRKSSGANPDYGLNNTNSGGRYFVVSNLYSGDIVTFNASSTLAVQNGNAEGSNNEYTIKAKGDLIVQVPASGWIYSITISHNDVGAYSYDPAVEIYDLYNVTGSFSTSDADFNLNGRTAKYITNLQSGMALNNRIAISTTSDGSTWNWAFNDHGLKSQYSWHNLSICNLQEGDRVVILYTGQATFSSVGQNGGYNGCAAYKDVENDGEFNGQDAYIQSGMSLEAKNTGYDNNVNTNTYTTYAYTVTEDGHLDIGLSDGSRIFKVTIYGDHQAQMLDRYNGSAATGYTAYFSSTGQLMAKEHMVPGGLEVQIGNTEESQHAIVVYSDKGPASFVYDQEHKKMARHATFGSFDVMSELPATGTYYKLIPEVSGYMTVRLKANSINYRDYGKQGNEAVDQWGTPNEVTNSAQCPYYLMVANGTQPQVVTSQTKGNGADLTFANQRVEAGKVYYIYGWWNTSENAFDWENNAAGVAQLIDVTFIPDNMVTPLAKWVTSGTTADENLADVTGFSTSDVRIKKKSDNIASCEVYIEGGKLKIRNITYVSGANTGGTILIKLGDPSNDANPVFAYTIAYDASFNMPEGAVRSEGHSWDFSTNSLKGLKWNRTSNEFEVKDFKTADDTSGLLYDEMHETNPDGSTHSDWTLQYVTKKGDVKRDPMYLNKYDMEGDNADMMWDTEGLIFNTASNLSCINNEFGSVVNHASDASGGTTTDPDRFVGVRNGGSFTIPLLKAGDRVIIYMGSADAHTSSFNITGALDAIGQTIESTDEYRAGGSVWSTMGGKCQYRGAYQFISTGGDMTFTLTKGELVKLYSIQIYRGVKSGSNDCSKTDWNMTYNSVEYIPAYQVNNDWRSETPAACFVQMHYRGKGERLRTPTVLYKSGNINTDADHLFYAEIGENNAPYIFFKSVIGQYGMFRMRVDDMESNGKYVADYALQNMTVGYLKKETYPYTWDFTDLNVYADTDNRIKKERTNVANYNPRTIDEDEAYEIEFMNNSVGENVKSVEQWKSYEKNGDIPAGLGLQVRNEPFSGGLMWSEGQLYAGDGPFGETSGLSIIAPGQDQKYNGGARITKDGLCLTGGNWKIKVPQVPNVAALYVRATPINSTIIAGIGDANTAFTYVGTATDGTGDKIYAVKGTGEDINLVFNNLIIKKIAISQDFKTVNHLGYATESRKEEIDPELMGYMTGTGLKAYTVNNVTYGDKASITLTEISPDNLMGSSTTNDHKAYIIYNNDAAVVVPEESTAKKDAEGKTKAVDILDGGFHLFVPDMHDMSDATDPKKELLVVSDNMLVSRVDGGTVSQTETIEGVSYTNYLMNYKYNDLITGERNVEGKYEAFYRASASASLGTNKAYLRLPTEKVNATIDAGAKFAIIFVNEEEGTETTSLDGVKSTETLSGDNAIYTLSGVKVSKPEKGGIYVKNGKKFIVK